MVTVILTQLSSYSSSSSLFISKLKPLHHHHCSKIIPFKRRIKKSGSCRAEFSHDAPFAAAIGACIVSSLILPNDAAVGDDDDSALNPTDTRLAAMAIISFIPYFNWLSWVFAWLDSGKRRYAVYALVYLAPYLRSNMSLSPEESWLPIASIVFGIIHVQLEASIRNGDIQGFQFFSEAAKKLSSRTKSEEPNFREHQGQPEEGRGEHRNLPPADEQSRNETQRWGVPRKPSEHPEQSNGWDDDDRMQE